MFDQHYSYLYAPTLLLFASVFKVFSLLRKKNDTDLWFCNRISVTILSPNSPKIIDNYSRPFSDSIHLLKIKLLKGSV